MTEDERQSLAKQIAEQWTDGMNLKDLAQFHYDVQLDYLLVADEEELRNHARDLNLLAK